MTTNKLCLVYRRTLNRASKKTTKFSVFDKKAPDTRRSKFLKPRSLQVVNDCFKNESNAVVRVFLQRLNRARCQRPAEDWNYFLRPDRAGIESGKKPEASLILYYPTRVITYTHPPFVNISPPFIN
jgi:hypothetical protein